MSNGTAHENSAIARYRVLRELGTRSLRTYAAARDDGSLVVLHRFTRTPQPEQGGELVSAEEMALLLRDARCLAKNWHPNLARVKHVELHGDVLDIATELVDGVTLEEIFTLASARRLHPDEPVLSHAIVARIFLDVLAGLSALHAMRDGINAPLGAFHGELCPANVVIGKDGVARLICVLRPRPVTVVESSEALGYAAPETLAAEPTQDGRVDLYAAGVMLWEALTERRLYDERIPARIAQRQREEDVARPEARLADVVMRALAFDPAVRFRNAQEMATNIRALAGTVAQGSTVAQLIGELAGERIRTRRAELEPLASGRHVVPSTPMRSRTRMRSAPAIEEEPLPRSDRPTPDAPVLTPSLVTMTARELRVGPPSSPDLDADYGPRPKPARRATDAPPPPPAEPALPIHALPLPGSATTSSLPPAFVEDDDDLPGPRQSTPDDE
ncbi:MAG: hypothetical protein K0S65_4173, partial [Labilithrix sp.]|nr:hypothetical protein [Labilithrix sp.]